MGRPFKSYGTQSLRGSLFVERQFQQVSEAGRSRYNWSDPHERIIAFLKMRAVDRPPLGVRGPGKRRPNRIEGETAHRVYETGVIHGENGEAPGTDTPLRGK